MPPSASRVMGQSEPPLLVVGPTPTSAAIPVPLVSLLHSLLPTQGGVGQSLLYRHQLCQTPLCKSPPTSRGGGEAEESVALISPLIAVSLVLLQLTHMYICVYMYVCVYVCVCICVCVYIYIYI